MLINFRQGGLGFGGGDEVLVLAFFLSFKRSNPS